MLSAPIHYNLEFMVCHKVQEITCEMAVVMWIVQLQNLTASNPNVTWSYFPQMLGLRMRLIEPLHKLSAKRKKIFNIFLLSALMCKYLHML